MSKKVILKYILLYLAKSPLAPIRPIIKGLTIYPIIANITEVIMDRTIICSAYSLASSYLSPPNNWDNIEVPAMDSPNPMEINKKNLPARRKM